MACSAATAAAEEADRSFVIVAKRAYTMAPGTSDPIENAVIVIRNGRIEAVGSDVEIPKDLPVLRLKDETVIPGLVDAANDLAGRHTGDETVAAGYRAVDTYNPFADWTRLLSSGVTTVHLNPGAHRLLTGAGAVVKLGGPAGERVISEESDLTINLGDRAYDPPPDVTYVVPSSSDVAIPPAAPQRPASRAEQLLELDARLAAAKRGDAAAGDIHAAALERHLKRNTPWRIQVRRAADIGQALEFLEKHDLSGYLVGVEEGARLAESLRASGLPVVAQVDAVFGRPMSNIGPDPDALDPSRIDPAALEDVPFALSGSFDSSPDKLRLAAAVAMRSGVGPGEALAAVTRVPARILGVADRVGSIEPGKDADLVVIAGDPLDAAMNVRRVFVGGETAFKAPGLGEALVIKAGTIWRGNAEPIRNGAVLVRDGKIAAVGPTVPRPPFARVIDAGPDSFVTPGFIDAHGHLGLEGDRSSVDSGVPIANVVGVAGVAFDRVARAGVTTVMLSPYSVGARGGRVAAIKTAGRGRDELVAMETAGVQFEFRGQDPALGLAAIKSTLEAGKKYVESWEKYEKELEKWLKDKEAGKKTTKDDVREVVEEEKPDPITGTWQIELSGDPLPETVRAELLLKLDGEAVEGRMRVPGESEEAVLSGTFINNHLSATVEVETPLGSPQIEADLDREDHLTGVVVLGEFNIAMNATRTDKSAVEFTVSRKRTRGKDGRPLPPDVDQALEPIRKLLKQQIPAIVDVDTPGSVEAIIKLFVDEFKVPLVLLNAPGAERVGEKVKEFTSGVIVPTTIVERRDDGFHNFSAELAEKNIPIAFQSDAEDGARGLPLQALFAVQQGSDPDTVLRALTYDAARMYKLEDRIGSLQPGRDADILIFSGHPFEAGSRTERVIINGKEIEP